MFPVLSQRILIPMVAIMGGLAWLWATPAAMAADGSDGFSLTDARAGVLLGALLFLLAGLPAIVLSTIVAALGNPLSGPFALGVALLFPAVYGGRIDGWLWRLSDPSAYGTLIAEMVVWASALLGVIAVMDALRRPVRQALPKLAAQAHFGPDDLGVRLPDGKALLAGLVCAGIGGAVATLLMAVSDTGQVIGALILAFGVAAVLTQSLVPQTNPLPLLLAPALLAVVAYAHVPLRYDAMETLYATWYAGGVWGPALALPIHYLGAGLVGITLGLGMSHALEHSRTTSGAAPQFI